MTRQPRCYEKAWLKVLPDKDEMFGDYPRIQSEALPLSGRSGQGRRGCGSVESATKTEDRRRAGCPQRGWAHRASSGRHVT